MGHTASQWALTKGYSRDPEANAIVGLLRWKHFDADFTEVWEIIVTSVEQHFVVSKAVATAIMTAVDKQRSRAGLPVGLHQT